ncbi:transglycosylase family protein [Streptomyces sp. NPDC004111]|uniref:transglycosylase family protein n=1 Tax=Streptomyces sp. NPDC004111 TaxID=3364690 RepID=UPI00369E51C8
MRSGNGRHRRPRQAPALIVAAGVTGSAIAIPLLGATSAGAAEAGTWDRVAECESGGMWSADLGNGFYGGLQFSQEKWDQYGGADYAERPDLASRSQQIRIANKVLAAEGPQAWPSCAVISGLAPGGGSGSGAGSGGVDAADPGTDTPAQPKPPAGSVQPDTPDSQTDRDIPDSGPESGTPSGSTGGQVPGSSTDPAQPTPGTSVGPSTGPSTGPGAKPTVPGTDPSADPSADPGADPTAERPAPGATTPGTTTPGGGKHRGTPAPENSLPGADGSQDPSTGPVTDPSADPTVPPAADERESGRHASRGGGKSPDGPAADDTYTVRPGDNLWHIADEAKLPGGWPALYEANKTSLGDDPDLIRPGQHLELGEK